MPGLDTPAINLPASAIAAYSFRGVTPCSHSGSFISPAAYAAVGLFAYLRYALIRAEKF
ncbi:K(+)-transporting ATPase subunit F [Pseudomonas veronii]|uniref:K(+)-transporting ATPase subunit F n=1 Tax=Pseudomonas veronii TaxID=76761 RepID=UPI001CA3C8C1